MQKRSPYVGAVVRRIGSMTRRLEKWWDSNALPPFATLGAGFEMQRPRSIVNAPAIHIGVNVKLGPGSELKANHRFPGGWMRHPEGDHVSQEFSPSIRIGDRVTATGALQVVAFKEIVIDEDVMFAANVFVSDGAHGSDRGDVPYKYQGISNVAPIRIGRGAWIGQNAVILPGVTVGELAIVGANSVVNKDVPPRTVVAGAPARAVKRWDMLSQKWARVEDES